MFRDSLDTNSDGWLDLEEMAEYVEPTGFVQVLSLMPIFFSFFLFPLETMVPWFYLVQEEVAEVDVILKFALSRLSK